MTSRALTFHTGLTTMLLLSGLFLTGCTPDMRRPKVDPGRTSFLVPTKKYAAPDAYNRIREVRPPNPIPVASAPVEQPPLMLPLIRLVSDDRTLDEVAAALGRAMGYGHYCAYSIANQRMTIEAYGDVETLGELIAKKAGIKVLVDHENKQIQFLTGLAS